MAMGSGAITLSAALRDNASRLPYQSPVLSATLLQEQDVLANFAALPSNIRALEAGMEFARGRIPFVALFGPSGWGKTHLMVSIAEIMQHVTQERAEFVSALEWLKEPSRADNYHPILLDEAHMAVSKPRTRHQIRRAIDHRVRLGRRTFLCFDGDAGQKAARALLGSSPLWTIATISEPNEFEREQIVARVALAARCRLHPVIARMIARHLHGNGRSIGGALNRLQVAGGRWDRQDDLGRACGVLMPYLLGADGWDIRDVVYEVLGQYLEMRGHLVPSLKTDLFCWIMRDEIMLCEEECATFLAVNPSTVYARVASVRTARSDSDFDQLLREAKSHVFSRLLHC